MLKSVLISSSTSGLAIAPMFFTACPFTNCFTASSTNLPERVLGISLIAKICRGTWRGEHFVFNVSSSSLIVQ